MSDIEIPNFVERDPKTIEAQVLGTWESMGGPPLEPGQVEMLFLKVVAYREVLARIALQEAALQNILRYAEFPMVDLIGELLTTPRLGVEYSLCILRYWVESPRATNLVIEAGSRVRTRDKLFTFATIAVATMTIGSLFVDVPAKCTVAGAAANGYASPQVSEAVDEIPEIIEVYNIDTTEAGADIEETPRYVERLLTGPDSAAAGSLLGYRHHALSASSAIIDARVESPEPGHVRVAVLASTGAPSGGLLALVDAAVNDEKARALTDTVTVVPAASVGWTIEATITLYAKADAGIVLPNAQNAAIYYQASRRAKLHRSASRAQLIKALTVDGVYSVNLIQPAADVAAGVDEWLEVTGVDVTVAGYVTEEQPSA